MAIWGAHFQTDHWDPWGPSLAGYAKISLGMAMGPTIGTMEGQGINTCGIMHQMGMAQNSAPHGTSKSEELKHNSPRQNGHKLEKNMYIYIYIYLYTYIYIYISRFRIIWVWFHNVWVLHV